MYKILSLFSTLRPPTTGNCTVNKQECPELLISLQNLKSIFESSSANDNAINIIKQKLETCINNADWDFEEIIEHDYAQPEVIDCVLYYMTGFLGNQILKHMKCETCCKAITAHEWCIPEDVIVNIYKDKLIPVNTNFYKFIKYLESLFQKHCHRQNVLDFILHEISESNFLSFPCTDHKQDVVPFIVFSFIQFRMRQICQQKTAEKKKENLYKKKVSKFCNT